MANIATYLEQIKNAVFGKDVRSSIHDGIYAINKEVESTTQKQSDLNDKQDALNEKFKNLIINAGNSNAEVAASRGSYDYLPDRLDNIDEQFNTIEKNNNYNVSKQKTEYINAMFPPVPLNGVKGDGVTDDYANFKAIFDYAILNKLKVFIPTPSVSYYCSQGFIFEDTKDYIFEGSSKEQCIFKFGNGVGIGFCFERGRLNLSNIQILTVESNQSNFTALKLGDTVNSSVNDSLHWSIISNVKITGINVGVEIGNMYDSSFYDVEIMYLVGDEAMGLNFVGGTNVDANNLIFNRLHIETSLADGCKFVNFDAGEDAATANFVFNGCHFETHRLNTNILVLNDCCNITFISCQITHTPAAGETVEKNYKQTFIFNNALSIKFISCGIGTSITKSKPSSDNTPRLIELGGACNYITFDSCMIAPPYQYDNFDNSSLFNIDSDFDGNYPTFINSMIANKDWRIDPFMQEFSYMKSYTNKMYMGTGSDYSLHISPNKWDVMKTPDDANNYTPFTSFTNSGYFRTAGLVGRHTGTISPSAIKTISYNTISGVKQSGLYVFVVQNESGNSYTALVDYNNLQQKVTLHNAGSVFSNIKDNASTLNIYNSNGYLVIQNSTPVNLKYSVVPFLLDI